ncbi:hypothetical protein RHMOL_Rhmol06G0197800 [Rhododendron molle]|uniref:Uncharacterized protein n=1 Tax=Rhododendron molle TaxID=49168 RepID=A0ACC0NEA8_RHOML|nr:hypothetical protein RHMOL_Rhmol06G0197800 [Rhododendron molle]
MCRRSGTEQWKKWFENSNEAGKVLGYAVWLHFAMYAFSRPHLHHPILVLSDLPRYRSRKGEIATNVLGVCSRDLKFVFVLSGWEGSATDCRILGNTISRPDGLRVPRAMDNTQHGDVPTKKAAKTCRSWRKTEEDALMKCMVTEISEKWRAENGFKPGLFTVLEKEMEKTYPRKAKEVGGKRFPYYEDWEFIFGKDRANGDGSEVPSEMARAAENENVMPNEGIEENEDCYYPIFGEEFHRTPTSGLTGMSDEIPLGSTPPLSTPPASTPPVSTPTGSATSNSACRTSLPTSTPRTSTPPANAGSQKGKKRTRMGDVGSLATSMEVWLKKSDTHMEKMSDAMGYSNKLSARRSQVPLELEKLDLTDTQRFRLGAIICGAEERLWDVFLAIFGAGFGSALVQFLAVLICLAGAYFGLCLRPGLSSVYVQVLFSFLAAIWFIFLAAIWLCSVDETAGFGYAFWLYVSTVFWHGFGSVKPTGLWPLCMSMDC